MGGCGYNYPDMLLEVDDVATGAHFKFNHTEKGWVTCTGCTVHCKLPAGSPWLPMCALQCCSVRASLPLLVVVGSWGDQKVRCMS